MILVDSSVWIDVVSDRTTLQTKALDQFWKTEPVAIGDLMLVEVLQGARNERTFLRMRTFLTAYEKLVISDHRTAIEAARNYGYLRDKGITIRKTIDTLIATRCIIEDMPLLYSDRDFDPFVKHLGLRSALDLPGVN